MARRQQRQGQRHAGHRRMLGQAEHLLHPDIDARPALGGIVDGEAVAGGRGPARRRGRLQPPLLLPGHERPDSPVERVGLEGGQRSYAGQQRRQPVVQGADQGLVRQVGPGLRPAPAGNRAALAERPRPPRPRAAGLRPSRPHPARPGPRRSAAGRDCRRSSRGPLITRPALVRRLACSRPPPLSRRAGPRPRAGRRRPRTARPRRPARPAGCGRGARRRPVRPRPATVSRARASVGSTKAPRPVTSRNSPGLPRALATRSG